MKIQLTLAMLLVAFYMHAQQNSGLLELKHKRFIDKVEFVIGSSLCLNYGNMFIDNYRGNYANGNYVENKRLIKIAYSVGVGVYHPINNWLSVNARVLWEQKGSKAELNHPVNPVNNNAREFLTSEYTYDYLTVYIAPKVFIGRKKKMSISLGGYYSTIKDEGGHISRYDTKNISPPVEGSFKGRYWYGFRSDGGINYMSFIPGLQSFEKNDYGASVGISYFILINKSHSLSIQLIDNYGLQNVYNKKYNDNLREKNHNLCLLVGYMFTRKEK